MISVTTHDHRLWGWAVVAAMAALFIVAVWLPMWLVATLAVFISMVALGMLLRSSRNTVLPHTAKAYAQAASVFRPEPMPLRYLVFDSGEVIEAREVALSQSDGNRMLLTSQGYVLTDADGQVIYRLS